MDNFQLVLRVQSLIFITLIIGFAIRKLNIVPENADKTLSSILLNVIMPCNIAMSFQVPGGASQLSLLVLMVLATTVIELVLMFGSRFIFPKADPEERKILKFAFCFSNCSLMGIPVSEAIFGQIGGMYAAVALLPFRILIWSFGPSIYTKNDNARSVVKNIVFNPCMVGTYIGLLLMFTGWHLPGFLEETVLSIGRCSTAISMLTVGTILGGIHAKHFIDRNLILSSILRLIVIPLFVFLALYWLPIPAIGIGVIVIITAMPTATTTVLLANKHGGNATYGSQSVFVTTLGSLVTLPVWMILVPALLGI